MLTAYRVAGHALERDADLDGDALWIDVDAPQDDEAAELSRRFAIAIPAREDMAEIESSSRYYARGDALYMAVRTVASSQEPPARLNDLAFILTPERLLTVHYEPIRALALYDAAARAGERKCQWPATIFVGIVEAIIDRLADILEYAAQGLETVSADVFNRVNAKPIRGEDFNRFLSRIHDVDDVAAKARISLTSIERMLAFFSSAAHVESLKPVKARLKTAQRDLTSLAEQIGYLEGKTQFLMDATLGLIGVDQNNVMKVLSVVSVMLMPPTLLAGIYGMNFAYMPELTSRIGYPIVLGLMIAFAAGSYAWFRRKGWI